jgi:predicted metalloprotease
MSLNRIAARILAAASVSAVAVLSLAGTPAAADEVPAAACASLDRCYGYADMQSFYDQVVVLVDDFSADSYANMSEPSYVYVPNGVSADSGCGEVDSTAFHYCRADATVYVGQDRLWGFYSQDGDAAAGLAVAHEWGHHVQNTAGVFQTVSEQQDEIDSENQADCIAGAWVRHISEQGILESGDTEDIDRILPAVASAEGPERDHGTLEERTLSVQYGIDNGLSGCNAYFPNSQILT